MLPILIRDLKYVIIVLLVLNLVFFNVRLNNYKELSNYSIKTSYLNLIEYANEISKELEGILKKKEIPRHDLEKVININSLMIEELYFIQTSIELLGKPKVISFEQYDVIQDLRVKVSKSDDEMIRLEEKDLNALKQLKEICSNINEIVTWHNEDILKHDLWINIIKEVNDRSLEYLRK